MRNPASRRRFLAVATAASAALTGSLLLSPRVAAEPDPNVLSTTVTFPGGLPAAGARVRVLAQPDVTPADQQAGADGGFRPEVEVLTAYADAAGAIAVDVPENADVLALADVQGGVVETVLSVTAQQGTAEAPVYFKRVLPVTLTLDPVTRELVVPPFELRALLPIREYDATLVRQLGEQTLADVGEVADPRTDELAALAMRATEQAMADRGYVTENELVAYNVKTADGWITVATYLPDWVVARPRQDDVGTYDLMPLTTTGRPHVDTTDAGDAMDDALDLTGQQDKKKRGYWARFSADGCYSVVGPKQGTQRYTRTWCFQIDHQEMDKTKGTSYWQIHQEAQGNTVNGYRMTRLWVHAQPYGHGTAPMTRDAMPKPYATDTTEGPCETVTDTISVASGAPVTLGFSRSWAKQRCSSSWYGPVLFQAQGEHAAEWEHDGDGVKAGEVRHVKLTQAVNTPTSEGSPVWNYLTGQWAVS